MMFRILHEFDEDGGPTGAVEVMLFGHSWWISNAPGWLLRVAR